MSMTLLATAALAAAPGQATEPPVRNVVLVHGAVMDGSSWRAVHDRLREAGGRVTVVQLPLTSFEADVAATREAIERQDGPVVLVGHSYGGAVITEAGATPKVKALVYVAAFQPDVGESVGALGARFPVPAHPRMVSDGVMIVEPERFGDDVAADLPKAEAEFLAHAQRPTAVSVFEATIGSAAWRDRPSWSVVATRDRTVAPDLQRFMYARSGANVVELDASHLVHVSRPDEVAAVIRRSMTSAD